MCAISHAIVPPPTSVVPLSLPQIASQLVRQEAVASRKQLQVKRRGPRRGRGSDAEWTEEEETLLREVFQDNPPPREAMKLAAEHFPGEGGGHLSVLLCLQQHLRGQSAGYALPLSPLPQGVGWGR